MKRFLTLALMLLGLTAQAATYYVATNGNDSVAGGIATPWLTQQHAWDTMLPGDTTLVQPGTYTRAYHGDQTTKNGISGSPITMRAIGSVTNCYGFVAMHSYNVLDGFCYDGTRLTNAAPYWSMGNYTPVTVLAIRWDDSVSQNVSNSVIQNCQLYNVSNFDPILLGGGSTTWSGTTYATNGGPWNCVVSNCVIGSFAANQAITIGGGGNNLIVNNILTNGSGSDCFYIFGRSNIIRGNYCRDIATGPGYHPDFVQGFMTGDGTGPNSENWGHIIEGNYVANMDGGMFQLEVYPNATYAVPKIGFCTVRNNVFNNCNQGSVDWPGMQFVNNSFFNCASMGFQVYSLTNQSRNASTWAGAATNTTWVGNLMVNTAEPTWSVDTNWNTAAWGSWFPLEDYNYTVWTNGSGWTTLSPTVVTNLNWHSDNPSFPVNGYYWQISGSFDTHLVNGGDPKLVGGQSFSKPSDFRPMFGSGAIDSGTNVLSSDIYGTPRPLGSVSDIGAFEYDPTLKLHYDFNESFTAGTVMDITGNMNSGRNFQGTNWITSVGGPYGSGALWTANGFMANDPPNLYDLSTYIGVTNLNGIARMSEATFSAWAWMTAGNQNNGCRIMDCGFNSAYAVGNSANSWSFGRNYNSSFSFFVWPAGGGSTTVIQFPDDTIRSQGSPPYDYGTANWALYTVTVSCASNQAIGYVNGVPFQTNVISLPYLNVYGCSSVPWICVGARPHDGTPQWGDDAYPNDGFFEGKMADIRIYNRALGPAEVAGLYVGSSAALSAGAGSPPATNPPSITIQPVSQTVLTNTPATFRVTASGSGTLAYQWSLAGTNVTGATSSAWTVTPAVAQTNNVFCGITNAYGGLVSSTVQLQVTNTIVAPTSLRISINFLLNLNPISVSLLESTVTPSPPLAPVVVLPWVQPRGSVGAYPGGAQVTYGGYTWQSLVSANVWAPAPGKMWLNLTSPVATNWSFPVAYKIGDVVIYFPNGLKYKCVQAHTSQGMWNPPAIPALWQVTT